MDIQLGTSGKLFRRELSERCRVHGTSYKERTIMSGLLRLGKRNARVIPRAVVPRPPPCRGRYRRTIFAGGLLLFAAVVRLSGLPRPAIESVTLSRPFFNPSFGQRLEVRISVIRNGLATVWVLDRDAFPIRRLASGKALRLGGVTLEWDGRDDLGRLVPDEAYSFRVELTAGDRTESYFPAGLPVEEFSVREISHDPVHAVLRYRLPAPSRVHLQVGCSREDPATGVVGPVLKTVVNRQPRASGPVVEHWNGLDESGAISVPNLPHFVISLAATPLPENSVITVGNRSVSFLEYAARRTGKGFLTGSEGVAEHAHHKGLTALDDVSPALRLSPRDAIWAPREKAWRVRDDAVTLSVSLEGPSSPSFSRQPGGVLVFVDEGLAQRLPATEPPFEIRVPIGKLPAGVHRIAVNWVSEYGPVTVNSLQILIGGPRTNAARSESPR